METSNRRVVLVDGNNLLYRSYFAMVNSNLSVNGSPTGAIYGTVVALRTYLRELRPTHMVWFFDNGKSELRTGLRDDYKGHRKYSSSTAVADPQTDLPPQIDEFERFLDILGIRHYSQHGVEADDLIARATHLWAGGADDCEIVIVSNDHDMLQLVAESPSVKVLRPGQPAPRKGGSVGLKSQPVLPLHGVSEVEEKYGLHPIKLAELWALTGDTGDNIKGIPGVGPKTAAKWLIKHGDLQRVLMAEPKCEGFERHCYVNWQMINLDGMIGDIPFDLPECAIQVPNEGQRRQALAFLDKWEMRTIAGDFGSGEPW